MWHGMRESYCDPYEVGKKNSEGIKDIMDEEVTCRVG